MKQSFSERLKWERTRERFRIEDRTPPPAQQTEKRIGDILASILKKDSPTEASVPDVLLERWPAIAGEQIAAHSRPVHLKNGLLYVHTDHPGWLAEIRRIPKTHLLKKIMSIPGIADVHEIRFQLEPALRTVYAKNRPANRPVHPSKSSWIKRKSGER